MKEPRMHPLITEYSTCYNPKKLAKKLIQQIKVNNLYHIQIGFELAKGKKSLEETLSALIKTYGK